MSNEYVFILVSFNVLRPIAQMYVVLYNTQYIFSVQF